MATLTRSQTATAEISAYLRARNSLLWIVSREESRVERSLLDAALAASYDVRAWDCATGMSDASGKILDPNGDPQEVLRKIRESKGRHVWILRDLHLWLRDPMVLRGVRSLAKTLSNAPREAARTMVILSPSSEVPPELSGHAIVIDWALPDRTEIAGILDSVIAGLPAEMAATVTNGKREAAIDAAVGLTEEEAGNCYARSVVTLKTIDAKSVSDEKKRVIAREKVLEWHDPDPRGLDAVGGLGNLKTWLATRRSAFSERARAFGLPAPKGCLLVGISGCGKSLTAKAVSSAWGMPLLRLDLGALQSKWVGESQANIRKALAVAETVSPCIVWLDEIEKALSGATQGAADGGVSSDALGAILNWMQERKGSVFVIATANDVSALPPELLRKGRFDEIFFVDTPSSAERSEIITAALKQHARTTDGMDLAAIAAATNGFTGAEIASLVPDALYVAFADGERALTTGDLLAAAKTVVPLTETAKEKIGKLREWAATRARPASVVVAETVTSGRKLDL